MVRTSLAVLVLFVANLTAVAEEPWWSLRSLTAPEIPKLDGADAKRVRNPIDAFVLAKLREKGLIPTREADARTLIRRLTFDLTGLPPTPREVEIFLRESS